MLDCFRDRGPAGDERPRHVLEPSDDLEPAPRAARGLDDLPGVLVPLLGSATHPHELGHDVRDARDPNVVADVAERLQRPFSNGDGRLHVHVLRRQVELQPVALDLGLQANEL